MSPVFHVDKISRHMAVAALPAAPLLALVMFFDVIARYVFNSPTKWAYDLAWMLYSVCFLLGLAHFLHDGSHVRVDIILNCFPRKLKAAVEAFFLLTTLLPFCAAVVWFGFDYVLESWRIREGSMLTMWAPPVYPIKTLAIFSFLLLGLQGLAEFCRNVMIMFEKGGTDGA